MARDVRRGDYMVFEDRVKELLVHDQHCAVLYEPGGGIDPPYSDLVNAWHPSRIDEDWPMEVAFNVYVETRRPSLVAMVYGASIAHSVMWNHRQRLLCI
jgi:hypothetical protein